MKLVVDIPDEFIAHYKMDKFEDSLKRIENDISIVQDNKDGISGNYENELLDMFVKLFSESKPLVEDFDQAEHYKKILSVNDKHIYHLRNCLKIFYANDCKFDSVKDYLLTMLKLGLIDSVLLCHLFIVFTITLYFSNDEIHLLLEDFKKQLEKE